MLESNHYLYGWVTIDWLVKNVNVSGNINLTYMVKDQDQFVGLQGVNFKDWLKHQHFRLGLTPFIGTICLSVFS